MLNVSLLYTSVSDRATRMACEVIEGKKKQHILIGFSPPRSRTRDLYINRYSELLNHPNFKCVFTVKGVSYETVS